MTSRQLRNLKKLKPVSIQHIKVDQINVEHEINLRDGDKEIEKVTVIRETLNLSPESR